MAWWGTTFVADRSPKLFGWNCTLDRSEVEEPSDVEMSLIFLDFHIHTYFMHISVSLYVFRFSHQQTSQEVLSVCYFAQCFACTS